MSIVKVMDRAMARFARRWPLRGAIAGEFETERARADAYARTFFASRETALVLADILRGNGLSSNTFVFGPDGRADPVTAAYRDGRRSAALEILHFAGGDMDALARALVMDDMKETRNGPGEDDPAGGSDPAGSDEPDPAGG